MKSFVERSRREADGLADALAGLRLPDADRAHALLPDRRDVGGRAPRDLPVPRQPPPRRRDRPRRCRPRAPRTRPWRDRMRHHTRRRAGPQRGDAGDPPPVLLVHDRRLTDRTVLHNCRDSRDRSTDLDRTERCAGRVAVGARTGDQFLKALAARRPNIWVGDERVGDVTDHPAFAQAAHVDGGRVRSAVRVRVGLPDGRRGDRRAGQRQPHDPALEGRPEAPPRRAGPHRRDVDGVDGPHARLHERDVRRLRRGTVVVGGPGPHQRRGSRQPGRLPAPAGARGHLAHPHDRPSDDRPGDRRQPRRQPGPVAQDRRHRARDRRARRPHPRHARTVLRRDRRVSRPSARAGRPARVRAELLDPDRHPGPRVPVPRPGVDSRRQPLRPSAVVALRRTGRVRDLRRRRGAARAGVHRRRPRRLQLGDGTHRVVGQHHAADHDPGAHQARVRVRTRVAGWPRPSTTRHREPRRCSASCSATSRSPATRCCSPRSTPTTAARACGSPTPDRCTRCARCSRPGSLASPRSSP